MKTNARSGDVALITCTRDRPAAFRLCETWMARQGWQGAAQWIVVDDGDTPITPTMGQRYVRRQPSSDSMTLQKNLLAALPLVQAPRVLFIEDDDYYSPGYVGSMVEHINLAEIAGQKNARYYHLPSRSWKVYQNREWASLSATGIRSCVIPLLREICLHCDRIMDPLVDMFLWGVRSEKFPLRNTRYLFDGPPLSIGIKGLPGRAGVTGGHRAANYKHKDPHLETLCQWIGDDLTLYAKEFLDLVLVPVSEAVPARPAEPPMPPRHSRAVPAEPRATPMRREPGSAPFSHRSVRESVVVYSAIFGPPRDQFRPPLFSHPDIRYVYFLDKEPECQTPGCETRVVPPTDCPRREARRYKMIPHELFPESDVSVWVDGSFQVSGNFLPMLDLFRRGAGLVASKHPDRNCIYQEASVCATGHLDNPDTIGAQVHRYMSEGYPASRGLAETGVLIRWHNRPDIIRFNKAWWDEISLGSHRDQVSFDYVSWRQKIQYDVLCDRIQHHPIFRFFRHTR